MSKIHPEDVFPIEYGEFSYYVGFLECNCSIYLPKFTQMKVGFIWKCWFYLKKPPLGRQKTQEALDELGFIMFILTFKTDMSDTSYKEFNRSTCKRSKTGFVCFNVFYT